MTFEHPHSTALPTPRRPSELIEPLLHERDAAKLLGMQPSWLARQRWKREEPGFIRVGRAIRYEPAELRRWIAAHRRSPECFGGCRAENVVSASGEG